MSQTASEYLEKFYALATYESRKGYLNFLDYIIIDAQPKKRPFREVAEKWQWERAMRSAPAIEAIAGVRKSYDGPRSFWNGYHKGSDKTHDNAREICWLLGWARTRLSLYVCAGSEDQAALLTTAMRGIARDNPWIGERMRITDLTATSLVNGSELKVLSMNAYTSQGIFPDYIVASEVTHWAHNEGRKFWDFILSSVNKRPYCVLKVETNAGHIGSWQWEERNRIQKSKYWCFFEAPVGPPLPSWMSQEKIDDDSSGMSAGERDRLYRNRWVDPGEEFGYLTLEECERCVDTELTEKTHGEPDQEYIAVVDYGGVNDRCSLAVMHTYPVDDTRLHAVVDRLDCWQGTHEHRIPINIPEFPDGTLDYSTKSVEGWIDLILKNFRISALILDPFQLEALAIKYERRNVNVVRFKWRQGQNNYRMAQILKTCIQNRQVTWSPRAGYLPGVDDDTIAKELSRLVVKEMAYGYRFDHQAGRHDDRACVIGMGLMYSMPEAKHPGEKGPIVIEAPKKPLVGETPSIQYFDEWKDYAASYNIFGWKGYDTNYSESFFSRKIPNYPNGN